MKKRLLAIGSILAMVGGAFVAGSLLSLYTLERQFASPLDRAHAELGEAQTLVEQLDRGDLGKLREQLRIKMDGLVLTLDVLVQNTSDPERRERAEHLLSRVARHREIYSTDPEESAAGRFRDRDLDAMVEEALGRYRYGPE